MQDAGAVPPDYMTVATIPGVVASPYATNNGTLWFAWGSSVSSFPSQEAALEALQEFLQTVRSRQRPANLSMLQELCIHSTSSSAAPLQQCGHAIAGGSSGAACHAKPAAIGRQLPVSSG